MRELTHTELASVYGGALGAGTEGHTSSIPALGAEALSFGFPWSLLHNASAHSNTSRADSALAHP
jgi:bacteriocin-like protein